MSTKSRIFIALTLPLEAKEQIQKLQKELAPLFSPQTRWIDAENLHFTLTFLGNCRQEEIPKISQIIQDLANKSTPLVLKPHYLKNFGSVLAIKMLSKKSQKLYQNLVNALQKAKLLYCENHKFTPHITVARLKIKPLKKIQRHIHFPAFKVEKIALIKSILFSKGVKYEIIQSYSLGSSKKQCCR